MSTEELLALIQVKIEQCPSFGVDVATVAIRKLEDTFGDDPTVARESEVARRCLRRLGAEVESDVGIGV